MDSKTFRQKREQFRSKNDHKNLPEVSLVASKESTAMFNVAGMQQLVPYLAGKIHPAGKKLFNIQKCIRTNDIDSVGDSSHLTFFEMMGNRSLGDYFKEQSVRQSYDFLVNELGLDPKKLAVTVFQGDDNAPRDSETAEHRLKAGIPADKISFMGAEDNRWTPGPVGPCGPDTEIFYRVGESELPPAGSNVENDEGNRLEIRNNVFMQYYRDESGKISKLPHTNVDTGMGFERMCKILQGKPTIFETDVFQPILDIITKHTGFQYLGNERRFRIIADHIRTASLLIHDGVIQSNVGAGYVLRMIIRRMYYSLMLLKDISADDLKSMLSDIIAFIDQTVRPINIDGVLKSLLDEILTFKNTISRGLKILDEKLQSLSGSVLDGKDVFFLYDTCGFPVELTKEICLEKNISIDEDCFQKELENQKCRSRSCAKFQKDIDRSKYLVGIPQTKFIGYSCQSDCTCNLLKDFQVDGQRILIFDQTPFYAESGGQKGDSGQIILDDGELINIKDVQKYEGVFLHFVG